MTGRISRDDFLNDFRPVYEEYKKRFGNLRHMKNEVNEYIHSLYPSKKKWLGIFSYTVRFEDKILRAQDDGIYEMIILNAVTIREFINYYEYINASNFVKEVCVDSLFKRFSLKASDKDTLSLKYILSSIPADKEWVDVFRFKENIENIIKTKR